MKSFAVSNPAVTTVKKLKELIYHEKCSNPALPDIVGRHIHMGVTSRSCVIPLTSQPEPQQNQCHAHQPEQEVVHDERAADATEAALTDAGGDVGEGGHLVVLDGGRKYLS